MSVRKTISVFICLCAFIPALNAQSLYVSLPLESPASQVWQRVGLTDVNINYHSPSVKGRKIWGDLVPFDEVWRAGANENTTISFSTDVTVNGKALPKGIYGLHMIPGAGDWTIIFSNNSSSWGSFFYKPNEDALRIKVKPEEIPMCESLTYDFLNRTPVGAVVQMRWERKAIAFSVSVDPMQAVIPNVRNQLRSTAAFTWQGWRDAAEYCLNNNINLDEALQWIEESVNEDANFSNLIVKAQLLEKKNRPDEAKKVTSRALEMGSDRELSRYGHKLMGMKRYADAIGVFQVNVHHHPLAWDAFDSLGEAYAESGNSKLAIEQYKKALKLAPDDQKIRIQEIIKKLEEKK